MTTKPTVARWRQIVATYTHDNGTSTCTYTHV
jgi:hypothetical protein